MVLMLPEIVIPAISTPGTRQMTYMSWISAARLPGNFIATLTP